MPVDLTRLRHHQAMMAPGTPLRDGLERVLRGRTGALVVLGHSRAVDDITTGGFALDLPFTPQSLRELAKMDGALIIDGDASRIRRAAAHLVPDADIDTPETGTRHRTADRVSKQTGLPTITVSASMSLITLFLDGERHVVEDSEQILSRANQALQTLERYRSRLSQLISKLSALEVEDQVTLRDLALVAQRLEMVRRLEHELSGYAVELGTDGRLLTLQLHELNAGIDELGALIEQDYALGVDSGGFQSLTAFTTTELLDVACVARALGFGPQEHLEGKIAPRGLRQLASINRLPHSLAPRLLEHFGSLQALFGASAADLQLVDGVGEGRAKIIREGLTRLAESAMTESLD
ncbi:DNA integrity scanning diadenylate cyclase DisA [Microlunatus sp. Y2014]|uniref:DNA integrity scanning diadenylate cyclase DisA n=1 Tax=Microlunatus sp. Y2014 TaxID=3418488 RepID=UPI003DA77718